MMEHVGYGMPDTLSSLHVYMFLGLLILQLVSHCFCLDYYLITDTLVKGLM